MIDKSAEAPAPDIVKRLRNGEPCKEASADGCCKVMDARSGCICAEAADELSRLTAENERLRAALEPFAAALKGNWSHQPDSMVIVAGPFHTDMRMDFKLGDFRRARAALTQEPRT